MSSLKLVAEFEQSLKTSLQAIKNQYKTILAAGSAELKKETKDELKRSLPAATERNPKYEDRLIDAVRSHVLKNDQKPEAYVHVMGNRRKKSGTYRTRLFEVGTVERTIKSGKYAGRKVGHIKPIGFFDKAITRSGSRVVAAADSRLAEVIRQINEENNN